jgi:Raf kinase inhibitor-like YbhB/YbcL family protein
MKLWSDSFRDGGPIPPRCAFGKHDPAHHFAFSDNLNPHLAWSGVGADVQSLVLVCHDPDVPSRADNVNKEGMTVPATLPRIDFYHWVVVELAPGNGAIAEGSVSRGITAKGKPGTQGPNGTRQGINDYTEWFRGNPEMEGNYFGYDGPAPPWNDERVHRYRFTLYGLDIPRVAVKGAFTGPDVMRAITGHIVDQASIAGTYHIYPGARPVE